MKISIDSLSEFTDKIKVSEIKVITSTGEKITNKVIIPKKKKDITDENSPDIIDLPFNLHPFLNSLINPYIIELNKKLEEIDVNDKESINQLNLSIKKLKEFVNDIDFGMIPYLFLETSFILFWSTTKFSPTPPSPPALTPLFGTTVLAPGVPGILSASFKTAFTSKNPKLAAQTLVDGIKTHASTISGVYSGFIPSPTGLVPSPPIPWIGVL